MQDYDKLSQDYSNDFYLQRRQLDADHESSGLANQNDGSLDMRLVRGSILSEQEYKLARAAQIKSSEDLTLDMLGSSNRPYQYPQMTSKNPPSSALNLMEPKSDISLEQYRQNNANLQNILMQFDSTP